MNKININANKDGKKSGLIFEKTTPHFVLQDLGTILDDIEDLESKVSRESKEGDHIWTWLDIAKDAIDEVYEKVDELKQAEIKVEELIKSIAS
jgi:hypothetical protein